MTKEQRAPKSPWQKYQKSSHVYSASYQHWREVALEKGACTSEAIRLSCLHSKMFGVYRKECFEEKSYA